MCCATVTWNTHDAFSLMCISTAHDVVHIRGYFTPLLTDDMKQDMQEVLACVAGNSPHRQVIEKAPADEQYLSRLVA
jgi:hypothetical protein